MEWVEIDRSNGEWSSGKYWIKYVDRDYPLESAYMLCIGWYGPELGLFKTLKGAQAAAEKHAAASGTPAIP